MTAPDGYVEMCGCIRAFGGMMGTAYSTSSVDGGKPIRTPLLGAGARVECKKHPFVEWLEWLRNAPSQALESDVRALYFRVAGMSKEERHRVAISHPVLATFVRRVELEEKKGEKK